MISTCMTLLPVAHLIAYILELLECMILVICTWWSNLNASILYLVTLPRNLQWFPVCTAHSHEFVCDFCFHSCKMSQNVSFNNYWYLLEFSFISVDPHYGGKALCFILSDITWWNNFIAIKIKDISQFVTRTIDSHNFHQVRFTNIWDCETLRLCTVWTENHLSIGDKHWLELGY